MDAPVSNGPGRRKPRDHHGEVRLAYLGGFAFFVYEGAVWLVAALLGVIA